SSGLLAWHVRVRGRARRGVLLTGVVLGSPATGPDAAAQAAARLLNWGFGLKRAPGDPAPARRGRILGPGTSQHARTTARPSMPRQAGPSPARRCSSDAQPASSTSSWPAAA